MYFVFFNLVTGDIHLTYTENKKIYSDFITGLKFFIYLVDFNSGNLR